MKPLIFLNFKTYQKGTAENALKLSKIAEKVALKHKAKVFLCVQDLDIARISQKVKLPVYAQHVDSSSYGSHTGHVTMEALKLSGARGAMINHSENRISPKKIKEILKRAKSLNFPILVCVKNLAEARIVNRWKPTYIAYEAPKLIGTGRSITKYKAFNVKRFCKIVKNSTPLIGAGISNGSDVKKALGLGAKGVLLASAFVKSKNPGKVLEKLISMQ